MAVAQTTAAGQDLQLGRPGWLLRLCVGTWLLFFAVLAAFAVMAVSPNLYDRSDTRWIAECLPFGVAFPCFVGLMLLTSREHQFEHQINGNALRVALRFSSICPLFIAICVADLITQVGNSPLPADIAKASAVLLVPCSLLTFLYLRTLARRIQHASLAEHCVIVAVGVSAAVFMMEIFAWCDIQNMAFILTAILLMMLFGLWSLYHFIRFALQFGKTARVAKQNWRNADAAMCL